MGCYEVLEKIVFFNNKPFTTIQVCDLTGLKRDCVSKNLSRLVNTGLLVRKDVFSRGKKSFYKITSEGLLLHKQLYGDKL